MEENNTREIVLRFTTDRTVLSWFTYFVGFGAHTHTALWLDDEEGVFYTFNKKGFRKEYLHSRRPRKINQSVYRLRVSEESYQALSDRLSSMYEEREKYEYSLIGVIFCLARFSFWMKSDTKWFCSQFVAKVLTETGCLKIGGVPEYTMPGRIIRTMKKSGQLTEVVHNNQLEPLPGFVWKKSRTGMRNLAGIIAGLPLPAFKKVGRSALWCKIQALKYASQVKNVCMKFL